MVLLIIIMGKSLQEFKHFIPLNFSSTSSDWNLCFLFYPLFKIELKFKSIVKQHHNFTRAVQFHSAFQFYNFTIQLMAQGICMKGIRWMPLCLSLPQINLPSSCPPPHASWRSWMCCVTAQSTPTQELRSPGAWMGLSHLIISTCLYYRSPKCWQPLWGAAWTNLRP